jgi:hypothetical protein
MNLQITGSPNGTYDVAFVPETNARQIAKFLRGEGGEKLIGFMPLQKSKDPAVRAFSALGSLAVEAEHGRGDVELETRLTEIFMLGVEYGKKLASKK